MLSKLIDVDRVGHLSPGDLLNGNHFSKPKPAKDVLDSFARLEENIKHPGPTIVNFSHSSVRDYLLQQDDYVGISRSFSFSEHMAHQFAARSCLAYLQSMRETGTLSNKAYSKSWLCLFMYLGHRWHTHAVRLPDGEPGSLAHIFNEVPVAAHLLMMAKDKFTQDSFANLVGFDMLQREPS